MRIRILTAALAAFFMLPLLATTAFAVELDEPEEIIVVEETALVDETPEIEIINPDPVTDYPENPPNAFTPSGTGTVTDYATDADGKFFYTIMTPDEHVFYLVIDRLRGQENVYFLNAVTVDDLMSLAKSPKTPTAGTATPPPPVTTPEPPAEETPPPAQQEQSGSNTGMYIFIAVIVVLGGGAGWYFKIYRPKQQITASGDEYEPPVTDDENEYSGDWDDEQDDADDSPPWDEDEDESSDEE